MVIHAVRVLTLWFSTRTTCFSDCVPVQVNSPRSSKRCDFEPVVFDADVEGTIAREIPQDRAL